VTMNTVLYRPILIAIHLLVIGIIMLPFTTFAQSDDHALGYQPDPPEQPGAIPHVARFRAFVPTFKDLSQSFPPPGDQGHQNSCVAWSVGYALRGYYFRRNAQSTSNSASTLLSPAYLYNQLIRTPNCMSGSSIKAALELMRTDGIATLADFPYDDRTCGRKPDSEIMRRAAANTIAGYRSFGQGGDIRTDDIKGALLAGNPVAVGLNVDQKALNRLRRGQVYDQDGPTTGFDGHAMVVTGFDDRIQAFKIMNSWGQKWAEDGFGWISYRAFATNVHAAFVVEDGSGPAPPTPGPVPPPPIPTPSPSIQNLESVAQAITRQSTGFSCSRLGWKQADSSSATLQGWVSEQANLDSLNDLLQRIPASLHVTNDARLRPWPQCEALMTVSDGVKTDHGMALATVNHDGTQYDAGTRLIMQVTTPDFPSYLYVTYLPANGDAVLLYKPPGIVPQAIPPRTVVDLGGGSDPRIFRVGPPFGAEMVVAVATASPLFTDGIPASATERDYLTALRKTLLYKPDPAQPDRLADASVIALTTRDHAP
jgi:hypothetical protein